MIYNDRVKILIRAIEKEIEGQKKFHDLNEFNWSSEVLQRSEGYMAGMNYAIVVMRNSLDDRSRRTLTDII